MPSRYSSTGSQGRELLRRLLLARLIAQMQQQQQQQQQGKKPDGSTVDKVFDTINKGQQYYNTGKSVWDLYKSVSGPSVSGSSGATTVPSGYSSAAPSGFSSVGEMVGNGRYTPGTSGGAQMQTPNTSPTASAGNAASSSGVSWGDVAPYVNTAIAAYNAYNIYRNKDMPQGQKNLALAGSAAQASTPWTKGYGALAAGAFNTGAALKGKGTEEEKTQAAAHQAGMTAANYWTAGLAGLADGFARKQWKGTMGKIDKFRFNTPGTPEWALMKVAGIWDTDKWKTEGNRIKKLMAQGVAVPEQLQFRAQQTRGIRKEELVNKNYASDFVGMTKDGWVNNKFNNSRNEADMRYEDLMPYATFGEKFGNDWYSKFNDAQRKAITQKAIDTGAVREHHGTVDVDWNKVGDVNPITAQSQQIQKPGAGQVARTSPGMYMNDQGRVSAAATRQQAMSQNYANRIPRKR